ncbi:MAG: zinc-binding alcohol dehydrogenase, partial [Chloroflexota bacterium]
GDVNPREGVLLALSATALHGVDVLNVQAGQRVLVIGQGPVGQIAARIAKQRGAWVAVSDLNNTRLGLSEADLVVNAEESNLAEAVGEPVDAIIEASGSMGALTSALSLLGNGGTVLLLGYYQKLDLPYMPLFLKEAKLLTAKEWASGDLTRCRDMIADGSLDVSALLTHSIGVEQVSEAYEIALNERDCLKLVMEW